MFSGIIQHLGMVLGVEEHAGGRVLHVDGRGWDHRPRSGDSISVNGVCLTMTLPGESTRLRFDVIRATLAATTLGGLDVGAPVNLEPAVTLATRLDGHLVQGHVDGVATVRAVVADDAEHRLSIEPPADLASMIVAKGSVAVDGVALTIAACRDTTFEVALIPTTIECTTLGRLGAGDRVNIETDYVAKIVVNWLERRGEALTPPPIR